MALPDRPKPSPAEAALGAVEGSRPRVHAEPTTLLGLRPPRHHHHVHRTSSADGREHDAVVRAGLWGVVISTIGVLLVSALMGLMRGS